MGGLKCFCDYIASNYPIFWNTQSLFSQIDKTIKKFIIRCFFMFSTHVPTTIRTFIAAGFDLYRAKPTAF